MDHEVQSGDDWYYDKEQEAKYMEAPIEVAEQNQLIEVVQDSRELLDYSPIERIPAAREIANVLSDIIKEQNLAVQIGPNHHVMVGGWSLLGSMAGFMAREKRVLELDNGDWLAEMELVRVRDGVAISGASAICGADETKWKNKPRNAKRSMAITRATGKAFRLSFGWVMPLAGYHETPAEEMQALESKPTTEDPTKKRGRPLKKPAETEKPTNEQIEAETAWRRVVDEAHTEEEITDLGKQIHDLAASGKVGSSQVEVMRQYAMTALDGCKNAF